MKKLVYVYILIIFLIPFTTSSQVTEAWVKRVTSTGNNADSPRSMVIDDSGNVYVCGSLVRPPNKGDLIVIKYRPDGSEAWTFFYNSPSNDDDVAHNIKLDGAGNIFLAGSSVRTGSMVDYLTMKVNSSGVMEWVSFYNGAASGIDEGRYLALDADGNVYITGRSRGSGISDLDWDITTVKYSPSGAEQWVKSFAGAPEAWDEGISIAVDGAGNIYVAGMLSASALLFDWNYVTIKYNSQGAEVWSKVYNGALNSGDAPTAMTLDPAGNIIVTGTSVLTANQYDAATVKYDSSGNQLWLKSYNGPSSGSDGGQAITTDAAGNVYITGHSGGTGTSNDFFTIKYTSAGSELWVSRYNGPSNSNDQGNSITTDALGNIYVTGQSIGPSGGINTDFATIKYSPSGAEQWVQRYNGTANNADESLCIRTDAFGNVYILGRSRGTGSNYDFATIRYSQPVGIHNISAEIPGNFALMQNYPNPFNPLTIINFSIAKEGNAMLKVYDVNGSEVTELINGNMKAGTYSIDFNASNLSSGVYFYRLTAGEFKGTKKMIIVK